MGNILEVSGFCKSYKNFSLKDVNFVLPDGCITGFIGINGAGKTTTIRAILGLTQIDAGSIKIFGKELKSAERDIKSRIGVVLDEGCFYDELTMAEMKGIIAPSYPQWSDKAYAGYMDRFSLNPKQKISTLSKGMRMKFSLTLALSHEADLLIMDEPTSGLDPLVRSELLEIMADYMKQGGRGVFFSTHITSDLEKVADMLILIHGGGILFQHEKDFLIDNFRQIKGDVNALTAEVQELFLSIHKTDYGFTGITAKPAEVQQAIAGVLVERPFIEEIMLAHIDRR
jgi:ABC-2 type transport system ATP-binding protein